MLLWQWVTETQNPNVADKLSIYIPRWWEVFYWSRFMSIATPLPYSLMFFCTAHCSENRFKWFLLLSLTPWIGEWRHLELIGWNVGWRSCELIGCLLLDRNEPITIGAGYYSTSSELWTKTIELQLIEFPSAFAGGTLFNLDYNYKLQLQVQITITNLVILNYKINWDIRLEVTNVFLY